LHFVLAGTASALSMVSRIVRPRFTRLSDILPVGTAQVLAFTFFHVYKDEKSRDQKHE
jgi:hypothetical protein